MLDLNAQTLDQLADVLLTADAVEPIFEVAVREDVAEAGDVTTSSIIDAHAPGVGKLVARSEGVIGGMAVVRRFLAYCQFDSALEVVLDDGASCQAGQTLGILRCPLAELLTLERPVLNFLGRLSGIATHTAAYVRAVHGTSAVICDTRKTIPGMRAMEKYAVRCGGGVLHRIGLFDAALYKDNHIAHVPINALGQRLGAAARTVRSRHDVRFVEVEVDSLKQFEQVLSIEPGLIDIVLLDNMGPPALREAVAMRDACGSHIQLESSGGVALESVREIAESGVDRIAVGAVTHGARWLDIGLDMETST